MALNPGKVGHWLVGWSSSQTKHTSTECNGHSFLGCFLMHLGQKMAKALSTSSFFCWIQKVSSCMAIVCLISLLTSSIWFGNSFLDKVLLPTLLFVSIFSRGMFSSSSPLEVLQICLSVRLRVLLNHNHWRRECWLCEAVGVLRKHFSDLSLLLQGMKRNIFGWFLFFFCLYLQNWNRLNCN